MCLWIPKRCLKSHLWEGEDRVLVHNCTGSGMQTPREHIPESTLTLAALAGFLGGTFSFCDRPRTDVLLVWAGGENRMLQFSVFFSWVMISSFKICRLILEKQNTRVSVRATILYCLDRDDPYIPRDGDGGIRERSPSCRWGWKAWGEFCPT